MWSSSWDSTCDDDCICGERHISPYKSDDIDGDTGLNDDVAAHMQAMEGMLQSCIDRGAIDKPSARAAIKHSKALRKRLG